MKTKLQWFKNIEKRKNFVRGFGILFVVYIVALFPMFRANVNYIDDIARVYEGYAQWEYYSRYMSNFLSHIVHAGWYLPDISPLPQLLAVGIMVITSILMIYLIKGKAEISIWDIIAAIPAGLSPYFLECLSFKYDAPYMAISVFASVCPLLFRKKNTVLYAVTVIIGTIFMCTTYQASSGVFPLLVILLAFHMWNNQKKWKIILSFVIKSAISYLVGLGIFMLFIMKHVEGDYSNNIATVSEIFTHYGQYFNLVWTDFRKIWLILIGILIILFVILSTIQSSRNKILAFMCTIITSILLLSLSFGLYPALETPEYQPRSMYGFGIVIAVLAISCVNCNRGKLFSRIAVCILGWMFVVFAATYGNAFKVQDNYTDFRIQEVIQDLSQVDEVANNEECIVQLDGTIGLAPIIKNMPQNYNMLNRLIPITFCGKWIWGGYKFYNYYGLTNIKWEEDKDVDNYQDWPLIQKSAYHEIYKKDNHIVIRLKENTVQ